nr:MAG TPA: hypothetical protein [Caudoviricetes sp.]
MGFRGYWFNNSGTYRTNKYPHCYVGIKKLDAGAIWGGFSKYDGTKRVGYGGFSKYNGSIKPAWGIFGGEIMTHNVTTFAQAEGTSFRIETQWHKLEGIATANATPLYDATGHKMENPNYVIDLYYKVIVPAVGKTATEVFFSSRLRTDLTLLCKELQGSATFINEDGYGNNTVKGAIFGSNPARGIMFLPSFTDIDGLPGGTVINNLTSDYFWAYKFQGMVSNYSSLDKPFLNTIGKESGTPHNLLLSGVSYTDTSITYSINPSFAACGIPVTANDNNKYIMPELRSGFVLIDNFVATNTLPYFGALYMCLDVHKI